MNPRVLAVLRLLGFRYSGSRHAYVLRLVGNRFGPVLRPSYEYPAEVREEPVRAAQPADEWSVTPEQVGRPRADRGAPRSGAPA